MEEISLDELRKVTKIKDRAYTTERTVYKDVVEMYGIFPILLIFIIGDYLRLTYLQLFQDLDDEKTSL